MVVFSIFSSGVLVSIHECCKDHHHLCCEDHHESDDHQHVAFYSDEIHSGFCATSSEEDCTPAVKEEEFLTDIHSCSNHSHCFIVTYLIKITDNFVGSDLLKNQIKSPSSIDLFASIFNDEFDLMHLIQEPENYIFNPPSLNLVGANFINFTSQRVYYA